MVNKINSAGAGDSQIGPKKGKIDPKSQEFQNCIFEKISEEHGIRTDIGLMTETAKLTAKVFSAYDTNHDGVLSPEEAKASKKGEIGALNDMNQKVGKDQNIVYKKTTAEEWGANHYNNNNEGLK